MQKQLIGFNSTPAISAARTSHPVILEQVEEDEAPEGVADERHAGDIVAPLLELFCARSAGA